MQNYTLNDIAKLVAENETLSHDNEVLKNEIFRLNAPPDPIRMQEIWQDLQSSKHFDFFKNFFTLTIISAICLLMGYVASNNTFNIFIGFASIFQKVWLGSFMFFFGRMVVDTTLYLSDRKIYEYMKRNGNYDFDLQEDFKEQLSTWERIKSAKFTYLAYFCIWAYLITTA